MYDLFFFSSRRRHTRYWRDWSSDVCSSDLLAVNFIQRLSVGLLHIIPSHRLRVHSVSFVAHHSVRTRVYGKVVAQLTELPNHLRAGNGKEESCVRSELVHTRRQPVFKRSVAISKLLISHAFFVMTFHKAYHAARRPAVITHRLERRILFP